MCVYVEAKGEYWGVFLYHSSYYFDTRSPLLLKAPLVSALSPAPGLQIFTRVLGIEAQPFLLERQAFTRRAISSPSPRQVFNSCLWSIGQFLRQDLAMRPRSALNAYCSYLSFLSAKSVGVCRHAMPPRYAQFGLCCLQLCTQSCCSKATYLGAPSVWMLTRHLSTIEGGSRCFCLPHDLPKLPNWHTLS